MKQIKLADFGHAREEIAGAMTSEAGTYRWMAPEVQFFVLLCSNFYTAKNFIIWLNFFLFI